MLNPQIANQLSQTYKELNAEGKLLSQHQLDTYYRAFRERFGPDRLSNLDGVELLHTMHGNASHDSMVYWLEFKNDDEFRTLRFGSIAGGSALKFKLYLSNTTHEWTTGSPQRQVAGSEQEAVQIARKHRDQFVVGCELLAQLPQEGSEADYAQLQADLLRLAPDVQDTAWGHKYFSLLFPDKLDDFHNPNYQAFHLIKLLICPPAGSGRYLAASRYVAVADELKAPLSTLGTILNSVHGSTPYRYWRIGTSDGRQPANQWPMMQDNNVVAIGWPKLGDLTPEQHQDLRADIRVGLERGYGKTGAPLGNSTRQIYNFITTIQEGDVVIACDGMKVLGIGRVKAPYMFKSSAEFAHQRSVEWLSWTEWQLPVRDGLMTTVYDLRHYDNYLAIEEKIFGASPPVRPDYVPPPIMPPPLLQGIPARVEEALKRKGQVILYGPPGTGKTYWAEIAARELAARSAFGKTYAGLSEDERSVVAGGDGAGSGLVRLCCFHPAYGYEDFLEGYRPHAQNGQMLFELQDGIFKTLCRDAAANPNLNYYLIVDEINRGDIPRIFGELLTILEKNKRGKTAILPLSKTPFAVPENVYVIGTMNTADRSIALLDAALRRRFGFIELMPDSATLGKAIIEGIPLGAWLDALNARICQHVGRDARNLQIGHSYFLEAGQPLRDFAHLRRVLRDDIVPLLQEYCYEDYSALERILGASLVDAERQIVRADLFEATQQEELVQSLLAPCPEITATAQVVLLEEEALREAALEEDDANTPDTALMEDATT